MSYRPKIKANASGGLTDLPLDAETIKGIDIVDSSTNKIKSSVLPAIAISETFTAASEAAMLALTAQVGDVCVRTDVAKTYILVNTPASTLTNWMQLNHPADAVSSVNGKTGAVTLDAGDVGAYPNTNPNGYISGITSSMVTTALGYTPYNSSNPNGYISGITKSMVTTALGYTPGTYSKPSGGIPASDLAESYYKASNPSGYISGITKSMVTSALGYTPGTVTSVKVGSASYTPSSGVVSLPAYPAEVTSSTVSGWGFTKNAGTVTKVNNTSPDSNGNVTISIPSAVTESTVSGWGFTKNAGTVTKIKVGSTAYNPSSGVISLPAYPTIGDQVTYSYNSSTGVLTITTV